MDKAKVEYNKYREPEAKAEILSINEEENEVLIKIVGSFCRTCGVDDWIDDFRYVLEDLGAKAEISEYKIDHESEEAVAKLRIEIPKKKSI